jgi:hypothetical protein
LNHLTSAVIKLSSLSDTKTTAAENETFLNADAIGQIAVDQVAKTSFGSAWHPDVRQLSFIGASLYDIDENIEEKLCVSWTRS